jgi:hypothetical protein
VYRLFKSTADGKVLEFGDPDITEFDLSTELNTIQDTFDTIDDTPAHQWAGGTGPLMSYNEMGLIGAMAICDAISEGAIQVEAVESTNLRTDYDYAQN